MTGAVPLRASLRGFEIGIIGDVMPPNFFGGPATTIQKSDTIEINGFGRC
jgi:hypothetical protein